MKLMTKAEYARHRGVGNSAVSNWVKAGHLHFAEDPDRPGKLLVNVEMTDARINSRVDPARGRPTTSAPAAIAPTELQLDGKSINVVRSDLLKAQLVGQELKNAQAGKELVPLIEAERRCGEIGRMARERMHSMFRSIAEKLAAERDVRQVMTIGEEEIDKVFERMAFEVDAGALDDDEEAELVEQESPRAEAA